ncbi:UNVERIFIED_CONTAM: hypothetical protein RMT77_017255 [Armadillidium vulgare]
MSSSLLYQYSSSAQSTSNSDSSSISLGPFNYSVCQGPSRTPLLTARRYSPRPVRYQKAFHQPELQEVTSDNLPYSEVDDNINIGELLTVKDTSPEEQIIIPYDSGTESQLPSRLIAHYNRNCESGDLSPISNNLYSFPNFRPNPYFDSNSSLSPTSPLSTQASVNAAPSHQFSPPLPHKPNYNLNTFNNNNNSNNNFNTYSQQKIRLKKSQSTLIMPSLLTLLRPDSVPTSTQIPKDVSSRSLNSYTAPTQDVRKCHTMVSLSMNSNGSNVATTTKVMKDRKPRFGFLRRISSSKSAIFTPKTATLHSSSLRKSPSATQAIHKFRKNSTTEMWPHPEHPEEGNSCSLSYEVDNFASVDKFIDSSSDEGKFGAGCSRCTSSTSVFSRRQSTITNDLVFCKLCLSDMSIREMYQLQQCQCRFCTYCMCTYTTLKIREGESIIECPDFNCDCKGEITLEEIDSLVGKELLNLHLKFRRNKEIESDPYKTWCPRPGCDSVVTLSNSKLDRTQLKSATCHKCKTVFCSACSNAWHPGKTCLRVAEHFGVPFNDIIKRCPRCKVPIERDAGCAQMQCKKCKHVFCWYCLVSLEDDFLLRHYDKGPCKNKLGHSRASVLWHRAQVIIIFAGFGLLLVIASPLLLFVGPCLLCRSCRPCNGSSGSSSSNSSIHDSDEGSTGIF